MILPCHCHDLAMPSPWQAHGKNMAITWQDHGESMPKRAWQESDKIMREQSKGMARARQDLAMSLPWSCHGLAMLAPGPPHVVTRLPT
jgi:hypothetical protein